MLMNTFEELTQAMDGCVERVKSGRTPDVEEDYVQYENIVGDTFEWVSVIDLNFVLFASTMTCGCFACFFFLTVNRLFIKTSS